MLVNETHGDSKIVISHPQEHLLISHIIYIFHGKPPLSSKHLRATLFIFQLYQGLLLHFLMLVNETHRDLTFFYGLMRLISYRPSEKSKTQYGKSSQYRICLDMI